MCRGEDVGASVTLCCRVKFLVYTLLIIPLFTVHHKTHFLGNMYLCNTFSDSGVGSAVIRSVLPVPPLPVINC